ncbi:MAG TPA: HupE/UreJ family protein [Vicinamibacterales bacterium]|nr:HupE/UreJ family protein [Vicinamibacterales bacterium]
MIGHWVHRNKLAASPIVWGTLTLGFFALSWIRSEAHSGPPSVLLQTFIKPEGQRLHVVVRAPLAAMGGFTVAESKDPFVDRAKLDAELVDVIQKWIAPNFLFTEDGRPVSGPTVVGSRLALPSDTSFTSYEQAVAHFHDPPLAANVQVPLATAQLDVLLEYPIVSDRSRFDLDLRVVRLGGSVVTTVRFLMPDHPERVFQLTGNPGVVELDPRWYQAALRFIVAGFEHILDGIDHLLFLFCLVLPLRKIWELVKVITAFTMAHSITLFCSAFGLVPDQPWFPPLIETLIAVSIVYMAFENIVVAVAAGRATSAQGQSRVAPSAILRRRWMITFAFGLIHGFGFSFALKETLQFAGSHLVASLLSFNIGVELGQMLVLSLTLPVLAVAFRFFVEERIGVIIASAVVAHTAWHWLVDRAVVLRQYAWYLRTPATLLILVKALMVIVGGTAAVWLIGVARRQRARA